MNEKALKRERQILNDTLLKNIPECERLGMRYNISRKNALNSHSQVITKKNSNESLGGYVLEVYLCRTCGGEDCVTTLATQLEGNAML